MIADDAATDLLSLLIHRKSLASALRERPQSKPELVESLDTSRSTVDRGIADLLAAGVVERVDGRYRLAQFGEVVYGTYGHLLETLDDLLRIRDPLSSLPSEVRVDDAVFDGVDVEFTPTLGPGLVEATFGEADRVRVASPLVAVVYGTVVHDRSDAADPTVEMVLDAETVARLETYYPEVLPTLRARPNVSVREVEGRIPFCLALLENGSGERMSVVFPVGDDTAAVLTNDSADAVDWARRTYEEYADRARAVDPPGGR